MENILSKDIPCEKCPLQFGNRTVLNMHMALVHNIDAKTRNTEKIVKSENGTSGQQSFFKSTNIFNKKTISVYENKSFSDNKMNKCSICDSTFSQKSTLKRHMESVHENKKPYKCLICDYSCSQKRYLKTHMEAVHENMKPHKCLICDYST